MGTGFDWIDDWNFGSRLPVGRDKVCEEMEECLKELSNLVGRRCSGVRIKILD